MLAAFCLRLALGMVAFLPLLPAKQMHPRFFRTQFLVALGLSVVATLNIWGELNARLCAFATVIITLLGAIVWTLDPPPYGRTIGILATSVLVAWAFVAKPIDVEAFPNHPWMRGLDSLTAGLFLGAAVTAMLVGHSYLISPGLSIKPLMTMIFALFACIVLRSLCLGLSVWFAFREQVSHVVIDPHYLYLIPRYLIGLGGPLVFGFMAYLTARIRSTQSATGILFVVVICVFLGELMSLVLTRMAGWPL